MSQDSKRATRIREMVTGLPKCRRDGCQKDARREWMETLEVAPHRFSSANINWPTELLSNGPRCSTSSLCHSRSLTMVDWHSPTQLARDARMSVSCPLDNRLVTIMQRLSPTSSMFSLGFICERLLSSFPCVPVFICQFSWEFCVSFQFDLSFISGKRKFRWPLVRFSFLFDFFPLTCTDRSSISPAVTAYWRL